jgi:hypothetical protein
MRDQEICLEPGKALRFYPEWLLTLIEHVAKIAFGLVLLLMS